MAEKKGPGNVESRVATLLARLEVEAEYVRAARAVADGGDYCDFFVENNNGGPFHEKCLDDRFLGLELRKEQFSKRRMEELSKFRSSASDDYPDFFVEGSGPPWHERIDDFGIRNQLVKPEQRAFALRRSKVLQTFTRVAEEVARSRAQR